VLAGATLQRFYFHCRLDDHLYLDPDRTEFAGLRAAVDTRRDEARALSRTARKEHPPG